jgi:hypothetical protein
LSSGKFKPQTINFLMRKIKIKQYNWKSSQFYVSFVRSSIKFMMDSDG